MLPEAPSPHISFISDDARDAECQVVGESVSGLVSAGVGEAKLGSLVPLSNIHSRATGIYINRAVQADPTTDPTRTPLDTQLAIQPSSVAAERTLELVAQYSEDMSATKRTLFQIAPLPTLADEVWTDVLLSRFVDLGRIYPRIATFSDWYRAFEAYESGVSLAFPHRAGELRAWRLCVVDVFSAVGQNGHSRVVSEENAVRRAVFESRQTSLNDINILARFKMGFPAEAGAPGGDGGAGENAQKKTAQTPGVCRKWNQGSCTIGSACRFRHVCSKCHAEDHCASECPKRRKLNRPERSKVLPYE